MPLLKAPRRKLAGIELGVCWARTVQDILLCTRFELVLVRVFGTSVEFCLVQLVLVQFSLAYHDGPWLG